MSSYIKVVLDTTPPTLNIYAPNYTVNNSNAEIVIEANEKLQNWQEIYIIDTKGNRHDYTFLFNETEFIGDVDFSIFSLGTITIYARVKDLVDNTSVLHSFDIHIVETTEPLKAYISESVRMLQVEENVRELELDQSIREMEISIESS